jgi:hypothetical protein
MAGSRRRSSAAMNNNAMIEPRDQVLHVSRSPKARAAFIIEEQKNVAQSCMDFRSTRSKQRGLPDPNTASADVKKRLRRLELFMSWMEINVEILSALNLEQTLRKIFDDPRFHFEEATRRRARAVHERCQVLATIEHWPPPDHPIWGTGGIMHRLLLIIDGEKKSYIVDPRYLKRIAKVYGHNGLQVGAWFALRWLALLYGAHNKAMDGIAGSVETGAYSVVISGGKYEELDQDYGDVVFYSDDRSHENTDPKDPFPSGNATLSLKTSQRLQQPVRVFRAAGLSKSSDATTLKPIVGIRYDGLYYVTDMQLKVNTNGGLYEQFKLERLGGQPPLYSIIKARPTAQEVRDFQRRHEEY